MNHWTPEPCLENPGVRDGDVPPPGAALKTVIGMTAPDATKLAGTEAWRFVAPT
jgi:hypothetical protein